MTITAEVILDSISAEGIRLITQRLRYPKFIHGEFMTHRVFSRNASSSRAIPVSKMIEEVRSDALRASPIWWGKEQKGMQAGEELRAVGPIDGWSGKSGWTPRSYAEHLWASAAKEAADRAELLHKLGAHKQIVNRILEPFLHINVLVTATEWGNFFGLRLDKAAQPEMRALAQAMWAARKASTPKLLRPGEWHLPFVSEEDDSPDLDHNWSGWPGAFCLLCHAEDPHEVALAEGKEPEEAAQLKSRCIAKTVRISVARCARVSYTSFETGRRSTVEEDLALYERLIVARPMHASPAEHQATPDERIEVDDDDYVPGRLGEWRSPWQHGNFRGWRQYRKMLPGEAEATMPAEYSNAEPDKNLS